MSGGPDRPEGEDDLREIPKWARRYAEGRGALPELLLAMVPGLMVVLLFLLPSALALHWGYSHDVALHYGLPAYLLFLLLVAWKQWQLHRQGTNIQRVWTAWFYRREGQVRTEEAGVRYTNRWVYTAALLAVFYGTRAFLAHHLVADRDAVPVTALWLVPFLVWTAMVRVRGGLPQSALMLLGPAWYSLHAVLILLGVPLYRTGDLGAALTVFGSLVFGLALASVATFIYSRVALHRLRAAAGGEGGGLR